MRKLKTLTATLLRMGTMIIMMTTAAFAGWSEPIRISEPGGHATPQILAQGDTLHVVAEDSGPPDRIGYFRSADRGNTWSNLRVLSDDSCQTIFPRIIGNGSRLMALWHNDSIIEGLNIGYATSNNNGISWSSARYIFRFNRTDLLYYSVSGVDSNINVIFNGWDGDSLSFYDIRSTNFGQTWSAPQVIFKSFQSGIPDQAGSNNLVHLVWDGRFDLQHHVDIYYTSSIDGGFNWTSNIPLSSTDQFHSQLASIGINDGGKLDVIWMDYKYSPYIGTGDILLRQSADSGSTWGPERQATFDHFAWGSDVASNRDTVHIAWNDEGTGLGHRSIYYTRSTDNGATWSEPYWLDGTLDDSADPALAISNGRVYAVWTDSRPNPDTSVCCGLYISRLDPEPDAIDERQDNLPAKAVLSAYPNPFNSSVTISYSNLRGGDIGIYDVLGKMVKILNTKGGYNGKIIWDATDVSGEKVASGIYFVRAPNGSEGTVTTRNSIELKLLYVK